MIVRRLATFSSSSFCLSRKPPVVIRDPVLGAACAAPAPHAEGARRDRGNRAARGWAFGLLIALLVQLGLGMYVNLFAHIPLNHPGHRAKDFFSGSHHSVAWAETSPHAP
jgi:hypothetical protein